MGEKKEKEVKKNGYNMGNHERWIIRERFFFFKQKTAYKMESRD